ncbi:MAG: RNA polymerase sigma factor RpoH [Gammaproteobacteria bacterium]|nr:RNA polymerase sigma factor RpoH [Gammaproteobacteria bacterium]
MGTTLQTLELHNTSLEAYLQAIQRIPLLSQEEEHALAVRYRTKNDLNATRQLVCANLRFVVHIAKNYFSFGLSKADLIQEGNIGLMKAVKHFDPSRGVRLISFAVRWIKAEIHNFIVRNWKIVKIATTKAQRKLFFNLGRYKKHLGWLSHQEVDTVARDLNVSREQVLEMESRLGSSDVSLEGECEEYKALIPIHSLTDPSKTPLQQLSHEDYLEQQEEKLQTVVRTLDDRSKTIITRRWLTEPKATLQELADHYKVSIERIRQIEGIALQKLKNELIPTRLEV